MAAPIPPMLKYSIVYNLLNFPPILIKFMSKFIVCKVPYFKAQYLLRLRSPVTISVRQTKQEALTYNVDSDETARNEPSHLKLQCLSIFFLFFFCFCFVLCVVCFFD